MFLMSLGSTTCANNGDLIKQKLADRKNNLYLRFSGRKKRNVEWKAHLVANNADHEKNSWKCAFKGKRVSS